MWCWMDSITRLLMKIEKLQLEGFRNYENVALSFHEGCNVIYGENAQGKTNLLEAMVYLSCGKSPRAHSDKELIGFSKDTAQICGVIETRDREFKTEITLQRGRRRKMTVLYVYPEARELFDRSEYFYLERQFFSEKTRGGVWCYTTAP